MNMSLDEMATFAEVVNCGNFTKAANKTGIPVSTISRRIADLEARLNIQLLYRTTRQQSLTDIGKVYFNHCSQMLRDAEMAEMAVQNLKAEPSGLLRVTTPYVIEDPYTANQIQSFMQHYPKITVDYMVSLRKIDLIEEMYDCAIIPGFLIDSSMRTRGLGTFKIVFCVSPHYLDNYGEPSIAEQLGEHYLVKLNYPEWLNIPSSKFENSMNCKLSTNDIYVARRSVVGGIGIACLPELFIQEQVDNGKLKVILPELTVEVPLNLVFPSNKQFTTKLRAFIDHMTDYAGQHAPWNK